MLSNDATRRIAFQGELGAFSHQACREVFPDLEPHPCPTFEAALDAVKSREADLAMMPIENSLYGRVADLHHLLPTSALYAIGEHFVPVRLQLLGLPGAKLEDIREAQSHTVALGQCRAFLKQHEIEAFTGGDTAGSARQVAEAGDKSRAAIASKLAGEIYGLEVLAANIEDHAHNTTRFLVMSRQKIEADPTGGETVTSFIFQVRNVPAALYKAMGGFATNGVNMVKLESFMKDGSFTATEFYAEIEGHPAEPRVARALEELGFFSRHVVVLGVFPAHPYRRIAAQNGSR
ncbi:prephenate dehydratase [Paralimibaculum aggregatum]|uniref:prephenate dehydratase n=1 Tax=Paralimibaculum aggregatum TaxID=3036245 RepID=A0ABQ6LL30_9RHOB|nr:prephenate dehydratase [Limibaculum sp. NKW23]GMG80980.1 prephenate dehydratase [Limibaculum sp. NKW23]